MSYTHNLHNYIFLAFIVSIYKIILYYYVAKLLFDLCTIERLDTKLNFLFLVHRQKIKIKYLL